MKDLTYDDFIRARDALRAAGAMLPGDTLTIDPNAPPDPELIRLMEEMGTLELPKISD